VILLLLVVPVLVLLAGEPRHLAVALKELQVLLLLLLPRHPAFALELLLLMTR